MIIIFNKLKSRTKNKYFIFIQTENTAKKNVIAKREKIYIILVAFGVSSNGRTRDFGSLYHGSNPCAPTKN